jgi:hypothetical protein
MKKVLKRMALILVSLIVILVIAVVAFVNLAPQFGENATGERLKRIQNSPNFKDGTFQNLVPTSIDMSAGKLVSSTWKMFTGTPDSEPTDTIKTVPFDVKLFEGNGGPEQVAVSWFGHSSLLIRIQGKTLLTDPVFGERRRLCRSSVQSGFRLITI